MQNLSNELLMILWVLFGLVATLGILRLANEQYDDRR